MDIPILLVIASLVGTGLNLVRGWSSSDDSFDVKKLIGGLVTSTIAVLATVSVFDTTALNGPVQTIILGLLVGFGSDYAITKLKK